jgi:ABC-type multidrug transport system fused ATPase/permease subunit
VSIVMVSLGLVVFISLCSRFMISFNDFTSFYRVFSSAFSSIQHKQSFTLKSPLLEAFVEERLV